jgi:transposase
MSNDYERIELITGTAHRRRWTTEQKLRIIEASCEPGESVSSVARRLARGRTFSADSAV